jgi:hypothetical protein
MGWRWVVLIGCLLAVIGGTASVFARSEPLWVCCSEASDCGSHFICCPDFVMGLDPCDGPDHSGFCVSLCIWPGR